MAPLLFPCMLSLAESNLRPQWWLQVNLSRGFAYVEFETRAEAEAAKLHMDGGQLDGNFVTCVIC